MAKLEETLATFHDVARTYLELTFWFINHRELMEVPSALLALGRADAAVAQLSTGNVAPEVATSNLAQALQSYPNWHRRAAEIPWEPDAFNTASIRLVTDKLQHSAIRYSLVLRGVLSGVEQAGVTAPSPLRSPAMVKALASYPACPGLFAKQVAAAVSDLTEADQTVLIQSLTQRQKDECTRWYERRLE